LDKIQRIPIVHINNPVKNRRTCQYD
jgi:hypothetical protein